MCDPPDPCQPVLSPPPASAEALGGRSLEDAWTFLEKSDATRTSGSKIDTSITGSTPRTIATTTQNQRHLQTTTAACKGPSQSAAGGGGDDGDSAEDYPDLAPFVRVSRRERTPQDAAEYDAFIDVPLPRCHSDVVRANAAKSAAGRRRAALHSSEEATRPFSRLNRAKTAALLVAREARSRREVAKARGASMGERGITDDLTHEIRDLHVLEQAEHPCLQSVPLLSRSASSAGAAQGQDRRQMEYIAKAFEFVEDGDHRVAAVNLQGQGLDDAWTALLGSTLETSRTVRTVMLNRNSIGDRGVALLAQSLRVNASVETLSLGGNRLTDKAAKSLASLLRSGRSSLKRLNLAGIAPRPTSNARSRSSAMESLPEPCISAMGAAALALALGDPASGKGCALVSLNLAFQRVEDAGAIALAAALKRPSCHLEVLGLSRTQLTDAAALAFARALVDGRPRGKRKQEAGGNGGRRGGGNGRCSLRRLDLSRNNIMDEGARALAAGIIEDCQRHRDGSNNNGNNNNNNNSDDIPPDNATEGLMDNRIEDRNKKNRNKTNPDLSLKGREARAAAATATAAASATATVSAAAAHTGKKNASSTCSSGGLLGLDLAFNSVGPAGTAALREALVVATGIVFLELRGNAADDPARGGRGHSSSHLLEEMGRACAERREERKTSFRPPLAHREGVLLSQEKSSSSSEWAKNSRKKKRLVGAAWGDDGGGVGFASGDRRGQRCMSVATKPRDRGPCGSPCVSPTAEDRGKKYLGDDVGAGKTVAAAAAVPVGRRRRCAPGGGGVGSFFRGCDAAKRRPLEGRLPMRGYYVSPLLDSCFDLLMLREPVVDPADTSSYINQARVNLEQRRVLREKQEGGDSSGGGGGGGNSRGRDVSRRPLQSTGEGRGQPLVPFPKGFVVSPLAIHAKREQVLAERRRLFSLDSDFASRKNARIAGRGSSRVPRSKLLTQRHGNAGFTRELMGCRMPGIGVKCPRGLRSHFMGLQNFEYDWGGGGGK